MKTWTIPVATAQQFAANDYVSACYNITCVTPNNNGWIKALYDDSNGNGVYDEGTDQVLMSWKGRVKGCGTVHKDIRFSGSTVEPNGFVRMTDEAGTLVGDMVGVIWFEQEVENQQGIINYDIHSTVVDPEMFIPADNANFS